VLHDLFKFTTADENRRVATMNSQFEFIVGLSYLLKSPRQTESSLSWLPKLAFSRKTPLQLVFSVDQRSSFHVSGDIHA